MSKNGVRAEMAWVNACLLDGTAGRFILITLGRDLYRNVYHVGLFFLTNNVSSVCSMTPQDRCSATSWQQASGDNGKQNGVLREYRSHAGCSEFASGCVMDEKRELFKIVCFGSGCSCEICGMQSYPENASGCES